VHVGHAEGVCRIVSASGSVEVGRCGTAEAASGSGQVVLADAHGHVRATSTSGRVSVTVAGAHDVEAETVSGRIEVSYPVGVRPLVVSPDTDVAEIAAATQGHDCCVVARSGSGRVIVSGT
jgi:hypothetical protein